MSRAKEEIFHKGHVSSKSEFSDTVYSYLKRVIILLEWPGNGVDVSDMGKAQTEVYY